MKGWIFHVDFDKLDTYDPWNNSGSKNKGVRYVNEAPHVLEMNKNPKWECAECGSVVAWEEPPAICVTCLALALTNAHYDCAPDLIFGGKDDKVQ